MNDLQIFNNEEFGEIKKIEKKNKDKYTGFFYVLEYGDFVKIGSTKNPYQRLMALRRNAVNYGNSEIGRFAISIPHTNYVENERKMHEHFKNVRKQGSELFNCTLEEVANSIGDIVIYRDDSEKIKSKANAFFQGMKSFVTGGVNLWTICRYLITKNLAMLEP